MKYDKNTVLREGYHMGKALWQIPYDTLLSIYYDKNTTDRLLLEYIEENLNRIKRSLYQQAKRTGQCYKIKYPTRKDAKKVVKNPASNAVDCYYCDLCFHWHTTTKMNRNHKK